MLLKRKTHLVLASFRNFSFSLTPRFTDDFMVDLIVQCVRGVVEAANWLTCCTVTYVVGSCLGPAGLIYFLVFFGILLFLCICMYLRSLDDSWWLY